VAEEEHPSTCGGEGRDHPCHYCRSGGVLTAE
jgi:hypothetical protein